MNKKPSSLAERQIKPQGGVDTAFPPDQPGEPVDRPTVGTGLVWPNREIVNYPEEGTRQALQVQPPNPRDFSRLGPAGAVAATQEPGGGILDLGPGLNPALATISPARMQRGPALNWQQFNVPGGTELDTTLGFPVSTFYIDNPTAQFMFIPMCQRWVAPFTLGVTMATQQAGEHLRIRWLAPDAITQPASVAGQNATVIALERDDLPPTPGYRLDGIVGSNIPTSAVTVSQATAANLNALVQSMTIPTGTPLEVAATVAAAANNQTLAAAVGKTTYITGFDLGGLGATAASNITITVTGITNTLSYLIPIPAGVTVFVFTSVGPVWQVRFPQPIPATAQNTAIVVNVPSYGAGNTSAYGAAFGFQL